MPVGIGVFAWQYLRFARPNKHHFRTPQNRSPIDCTVEVDCTHTCREHLSAHIYPMNITTRPASLAYVRLQTAYQALLSAARSIRLSSMSSRFFCLRIFLVRPSGFRFSQVMLLKILVRMAYEGQLFRGSTLWGRAHTIHTIRTQKMGPLHSPACGACIQVCEVPESFACHEPLPLFPVRRLLLGHGLQ
jgi:hypothetical protein